ncbi:hypothetical protein OKW96_16180 [Sphingobacterium sp. KU25419]|nr:hypothetical protein OKW96_16180 [Sphingobacterium sp. KU25419]
MKTTHRNKSKNISEKLHGRADKKQRELATWMQAQSGRLSVPMQKKLFLLFTIMASTFFVLIIVGALKQKDVGTIGSITAPNTEHNLLQDSSRATNLKAR